MSNCPTPIELDNLSKIKITRWIVVKSPEFYELDDTPAFTLKIIKMGFSEPAFLFTDSDGRIFGKGSEGSYYPFHFERGSQKIGYRLIEKACN